MQTGATGEIVRHEMIIAHLTRSFRETFPARASEWALSAMLFNWFLVLSLNADLFVTGSSYPALAAIAEQSTWALLCMVCGGGRLIILAINGAWRRSPHMRAFGAFVSCLFWFEITIGMAQSGQWSTGLAIYPVLLLLDSWNVIRAMGEASISDATHKRVAKDDDSA